MDWPLPEWEAIEGTSEQPVQSCVYRTLSQVLNPRKVLDPTDSTPRSTFPYYVRPERWGHFQLSCEEYVSAPPLLPGPLSHGMPSIPQLVPCGLLPGPPRSARCMPFEHLAPYTMKPDAVWHVPVETGFGAPLKFPLLHCEFKSIHLEEAATQAQACLIQSATMQRLVGIPLRRVMAYCFTAARYQLPALHSLAENWWSQLLQISGPDWEPLEIPDSDDRIPAAMYVTTVVCP